MRLSLSSWKALGTRVIQTVAVLGALLVPSVASAGVTYTFYPSGASAAPISNTTPGVNDLGDLDHAYYYAWNLSGLSKLANQGLVSASVTFRNLFNWNANSNVLHLDLLDAANPGAGAPVTSGTGNGGVTTPSGATVTVTSTVRSAADNAPATPTRQSDMTNDIFDSPTSVGTLDCSGTPTPAGCASTQGNWVNLSDRSFVAQNTDPSSTTTLKAALASLRDNVTGDGTNTAGDLTTRQTWAETLISPPGWTWSTGVNGGYDYTYTFTGSDRLTGPLSGQLLTLSNYISNGGDVALAFDPDCHFYNDGVSFKIVTNDLFTGASAVPEPASFLLLGTGLVMAARFRRRSPRANR